MTRLAALALVVRNIERALALYEGLGFERVEELSEVPSLGARHVVLRADNCVVELLEPHDETKPPGLFLRARGEGVFALELRVSEPAARREALARGFVQARGSDESWYVPPGDAQGVLIRIEPAEPEPAE